MQAGSFFPDAFYTCLGNSEAAEAAHWPPFLEAAVKFWKAKYGKESDSHEGRLSLKAFLYGAFTHQIADVSWHSLGVQQGMLSMLAANDFDGDTSSAHR